MKGKKRGKRGAAGKVVCPWLGYVSVVEPVIKPHARVTGQQSKSYSVSHCLFQLGHTHVEGNCRTELETLYS